MAANAATPFIEIRSFEREEPEATSEAFVPAAGSPFLSVYEMEGHDPYVDPEREAYAALVQELHDEEFDEALFELLTQARGLHEEHLISGPQSVDGERLLNQHFRDLIREAEAAVSAFEREFGARDAESVDEAEIDAFADRYAPSAALNPEFEQFLGKWKKKIAGFAKKAIGFAKKAGKAAMKLGLGKILGRLKALVNPLLTRVLDMAIGKLPEELRPLAEQLADRIFKRQRKEPDAGTDAAAASSDAAAAATPADATSVNQAPSGTDVTEIQNELDQQFANLLLASDEAELELEAARGREDLQRASEPVFASLDEARERFIGELQNLREGEDPTPYVQNFLPAVLPALRLGVKLAGRERIVNFLAGLLSKLIAKLIGPESAPALSRAIVNAGLKLLTLETTPQDESRAAASAVASTVEETMRRVANLPGYVLDSQELLEGFALEAFEQSAAANLPPILPDSVYRERPELLESQYARTAWIALPLRRHKRYKKCGRTFKVRITPYMADEIESFEGPLSDYLHDQLAIDEGAEVEAEVHLYEALPGTTLPDIARGEAETAGMQATASNGASQLHPLTSKAAGLLLGEPRLGRNLPSWTTRLNVPDGARFYRLAIPGKRILAVPGPDGRPRQRRLGGIAVMLDVPKDEIRISIFLSEVKAQRLAVKLRRQPHPGAIAVAFQKYIARRLTPILRGERPARLRVVFAGLQPGPLLAAALQRLPAEVTNALIAKLQESMVGAFAELAKSEAQRFITAAEDTADGVTMQFTIARLSGLIEIAKALLPGGNSSGLAALILRGAKPDVRIQVNPGYTP